MRTIRNHKAKVDFIYRFLLNGSSDSQDQNNSNHDPKYYLIIIGKGGTGKTTALNEALDKSNELDNIHIWNEGEKPYLINFNSTNDLHIFIRQEDDNFVKCLQNEFECVTVQFETDDLIIEQTRAAVQSVIQGISPALSAQQAIDMILNLEPLPITLID
jgi:hypothetical protein